MGIIELKNTIAKIKNSFSELDNSLEMTMDGTSKLEG